MYARSLPKSFVSIAAGALFGLSLGCIITTSGGGSDECGSLLSHSHVGSDGDCYCDAGYTWENPDDDTDFDCEKEDPKGGGNAQCVEPNSYLDASDNCHCDPGYKWCAPSDPNDYTCCVDDAQDTNAGTGDTDDMTTDPTASTGPETGDTTADSTGTVDDTGGSTPDPSQCTTDNEGTSFCSNTAAMGPEGSTLWRCMSGEWVEVPQADLDAECMFDNYDFAYGCTDEGDEAGTAGPVCGFGSGAACDGDTTSCADDDLLDYCQWGKQSQVSCLAVCQDPEAKMTYDHGFCAEDSEAMGTFDCFCCDSGDEGCPV